MMISITKEEIKFAVLGGVLAEITFELYAWFLSPILFGPTLQPAKLVMALTQQYAGIELSYQAAFVIHALIGTVGFGLFVLAFKKLLPLKAYISGFIAGVALWFIAQGILAPAIGRPFMMEFGTYTQSSFVGHVGMAMIISVFLDWCLRKKI